MTAARPTDAELDALENCLRDPDKSKVRRFDAADAIAALRAALAKVSAERDIALAACDAAESILRYSDQFSTNCGGTKPTMTTRRALELVRAAVAKADHAR